MVSDKLESKRDSCLGKCLVERKEKFLRDQAQNGPDESNGNGPFCKAEDLVEERLGIAQAAVGKNGDQVERFRLDGAS